MTCLSPRQGCECLGMSFTASYKQLRKAPPAFTTLTLTVPHQVSPQAGVCLSQGMSLMGDPLATAWSTTGSTSPTTGWTPPGQPVFPCPATGNAPHPPWADGWCISFQEWEQCASSEAILPHYPITVGSVPGYSLHTLSGGSKEGLLHP